MTLISWRKLYYFAFACKSSCGFKYTLDSYWNDSIISFSEQYMYGTDKGPLGFQKGESSIQLDLDLSIEATRTGNFSAALMFYRDSNFEIEIPDLNLCQRPTPVVPSGFRNIHIERFTLEKKGNAYEGKVQSNYKVTEGGLFYALLRPCNSQWSNEEFGTRFNGTVVFRNPYGYIPGSDYGYMPFEAVRGCAFLVLAVTFGVLTFKNRNTALPLHWITLAVLCIAFFESFSWFGAYVYVNKRGIPYCCPYPSSLIFAMAIQVLLRTTVRLLLLAVCLGYGIVRPDLERREKVSICLLTAAFFITGIMELTTQARLSTKFGSEATIQALNVWALPAFITDLIFLTWIYSALLSMMEKLREHQESYKLAMYEKLARCISFFVLAFMMLLIGVLGIQSQSYNWLWQWLWLLDVAFEVLNFNVLAAVCIIWKPTRSSGLLSYSKQLATSEEQADGNASAAELRAHEVEMVIGSNMHTARVADSSSFTIMGDRDSDDEDEAFSFNQNKPSLNPFGNRRGNTKAEEELGVPDDTRRDLI